MIPLRFRGTALALLLGWLSPSSVLAQPATTSVAPPLTNVLQVRKWTSPEAGSIQPVHLPAVVTFCDPDGGLLFVQDETGGVFVNPQEPVMLPAGTRVEITGLAQPGSHLPFIAKAVLFDRGFTPMPAARPVSLDQLATGSEDSNWIETVGVVRSIQFGSTQARIVLAAGQRRIVAHIIEVNELPLDVAGLVDAEMRVRGVAGAPPSAADGSPLMNVHVPHPRYVTVRRPGTHVLEGPLRTTAWLHNEFPTNTLAHRIRVRGTLVNEPGQPLRLRDDHGTVTLSTATLTFESLTNTLIEVAGFPAGPATDPRLENIHVSVLSQAQPPVPPTAGQPEALTPRQVLPVLTDISQVRRLSAEQAARNYPVKVRGVITFSHLGDDGGYVLFVQDNTAGIYVRDLSPDPTNCPAGRAVELEGVSDPGEFAPIIRKDRVTILGEAPLPAAIPATIDELLTGRMDSHRVRIQGIITRVRSGPRTVVLGLLMGRTVLDVYVPAGPGLTDPERLVDASVRLAGVCGTSFNSKRQLEGLRLFVRRQDDMRVIKPAPADPFDAPLRSIRSLFQFDPGEDSWHRVRVQGVVTLQIPGVGIFFQDERDGLFVRTTQPEPLEPGDQVEVIGFPQPGRPDASLIETRFKRSARGIEPPPDPVTPLRLASREFDNRLVVLEGRLLEKRGASNQTVLVCQTGDRVFDAEAQAPWLHDVARSVGVGSQLRLSGVWAVHSDLLVQTRVSHLLLRSARDLVVLQSPSWWTPRHSAVLGGGLLVVVLASLAWAFLLHQQVAERTAQTQNLYAQLQASIAQSPSGILIADAPDVTIRMANPAALRIRAGSQQPLPAIDVSRQALPWEALHPDGTPYPSRELPLSRAVLKGETTQNEEFIIRNDQGCNRWVVANAAPIRNPQGAITGGIFVFDDITERKRVEQALRESEERYRSVFDGLPAGLCRVTPNGTFLAVNPAMVELLGYPNADSLLASNAANLYVDIQDRESRLAILVAGGLVDSYESRLRRFDGSIIWVRIRGRTVRDAAGAVRFFETVLEDITQRKRAEAEREQLQSQLLQAQKMESVGRLAGGVAHDFNNMLQTILGNVALALEEQSANGPLREHLDEIQKAAQRSADLTRQLLAFARKQTARPQILDLNDTVPGLLKMLRRLIGEDIQLVWVPGPHLWTIRIDPSQLDQVLANLTVNARDAIQQAGHIAIETGNVTIDSAVARPEADCVPGDYVRLTVRDNGRGMSGEIQEHLFEPFFTTKAVGEGTGLGLATVYGIVKQNGGAIEVDTTPGEGSAFSLYFPRAEALPTPSGETAPHEHPHGSETVLLVEDEDMVLSLGRRILEQHGYTVLTANLPERAIRLAAEQPAPIHLLITDVVMPGMNGRELNQHLAALRPGLRCLFMSGYTADAIAHQGVLEPGVQFLQKPFTIAAFTRKVRETLDAPS